MLIVSLLLATMSASDPVEFAYQEVKSAFARSGVPEKPVAIAITGKGGAESYVVTFDSSRAIVEGADAAGAMYGGLEVAERIRLKGASAFTKTSIRGNPYLADRGLNVFLTLPWNYAKNNTDYDPEALNDPNRWWFQNDDYWHMLFDSMARHRMNWLDIHGTWDVSVTDAPNLYAYFIQSEKYPEVGVAPEIKAKNLAQLNKVIELAHSRGIRVSLMAYEARLTIPQKRNVPYPGTEKVAYEYTREMVEKMIRQAPKLDAIGYRIGESGKGESFFTCYQEAVKASGKNIPLLTRTWITRKANVLPLAKASDNYSTQIKYNGEQWGPPYMVAGGRMAGWYSYSFEDYLSFSGNKGAKKVWSGNPTEDGGKWPSNPYKPIWQVRLNGTHRIFPFYQPDWVRRTVETMKVGTAAGFTVEPMNAYYPDSPAYYLANPNDQWTPWILDRDEPFIFMWGRFGYDPKTPQAVFDLWFKDQFGDDGAVIEKAWRIASKIVPTAYTAYSLGPDHRSQTSEMELGGNVNDYILQEPFDAFVVQSANQEAFQKVLGLKDGRTPNAAYAETLRNEAAQVRTLLSELNPNYPEEKAQKRAKELINTMKMLCYLADYYASRFESAHWQALVNAGDANAQLHSDAAMQRAVKAWTQLSESDEANYYKPFTERLRMHTNTFHWRSLLPELKSMLRTKEAISDSVWTAIPGPVVAPASAKLTWKSVGKDIVCSLPAKDINNAWLVTKPLPSTTFFHKMPMTREGDAFVARFERQNCGHLIAADVEFGGQMARVPYWETATPYLTVPSIAKPTPLYYSSEEAMSFLKPSSLTSDRYGALLLPTRSQRFFRYFDLPTQRKILDPVERGMKLVVLQQDYLGGRYDLKWLPVPPKIVGKGSDVFDPGGAMDLPVAHAPGILWQVFTETPGWEIFGNGGIARYRLGKGEIWLVQARALQLASYPEAARFLGKLLSFDKSKPVVLLDHSGEGADSTSSFFSDSLNALGVPFVTLGEVIAKEQGMDSMKVVPGNVSDDSVLSGQGPDIMNKFLLAKVKAAAARPIPSTKEDLEKDKPRRKKELMMGLGLDPLPARTPLNARVTGVIQRKGYRLEKIVFESRPGFPVTGHLYIPDGPAGTKYPVILNPHGHWAQKKMQPVVQMRLIAQALNGYVSFVIDVPGESWEGENLVERREEGSHWDFPLVVGGAQTTGVYVWDMMRALDYLETRPECDMSKIGLTGASGGGLATMYEFAADERIKVAVPVVYAVSMEIAPGNGCPCNHVPATLQVGDRSDVMAIRAPAPVYLIGAHDDGEFPPEGTKLSGEKLKKIYSLYGVPDHTGWEVFAGPHDYNKLMRERAMGFFDRFLKGKGDGSPIPEPEITTENPSDPQFLALSPVPPGMKTMRDIARENLKQAHTMPFENIVKLNGGMPKRAPLSFKMMPVKGDHQAVTFRSEAGLTIPGLLWLPKGTPKGGVVLVSENGKIGASTQFGVPDLVKAGYAVLAIDVRGVGELTGLEIRLMTYLGTSDSFAMATDVCAAVDALRKYAPKVAVVGSGSAGAQVAMFAALMDPKIVGIAGLQGMHSYAECLDLPKGEWDAPGFMLQPRANCGAPLDDIRSLVKCKTVWSFSGDKDKSIVDLVHTLL